MDHKASVLVQIDLQGAYVRLVVTGCLTEANQHVLHPLVTRARTMIPSASLTVDMSYADHLEPSGVELLRWALEQDPEMTQSGPVEILVPAVLPTHSEARPPSTRWPTLY